MMEVSPEDERYLIDESEHVDRLRDCDVRRLGVLVGDSSTAGLSDWKTLAGRLGVDNVDVRYVEATRRLPGEETLKLWRRKEGSTIRVLREALRDMHRDDVVRELDYMRLNMVSFSMVLMRDGHENDVLSIKCPGRKPLIEHVRPLLLARRHDGRTVVHLQVGSVVAADGSVVTVNWSSPAELFAGQQWTLTLKSVPPSALDRNSAPVVFRPKVDVKRNFVSDGETLAETLFEISETADNVVDLKSDDDLQPPPPEIDDRTEVREARQLAGFHDIDPQCRKQVVEMLLSPYLKEQGRYILRTSSSQPDVTLAISVTHNEQIRHYYIFSKHQQSCVLYCVHINEGYWWDSLRSLIDHYRRHPIELCPDADDLLLTEPVL